MGKFTLLGIVAGLLLGGKAVAAEWQPVKQGEDTVREIDMASMSRNGPAVTFTTRHTFMEGNEYKVGRREVKYLLIFSRVNCSLRTLTQLATEAYDEKLALISKQKIQLPQDIPVTRESIDESVLNFVCVNGRQESK